jgi:hypothetical protein
VTNASWSSWLGDAGAVGVVESQLEQLAMGIRDLSWYRKGPRRLRARFAKKVLSSRGRRYPEAVFMAALKTTLRHRNREARAAWALLSEEEQHKKRIEAMVLLATPGLSALFLASVKRVSS